jgi:aspartate-semialdehyde dehydrogenase
VLEGHTESVFVELARPASAAEVKAAWAELGSDLAGLPSAPTRLISYLEDPYRPQPRLDRDTEDGMVTTVGRLRPDGALANGWKYMLVSHNTKMGAAKGAILAAEHLDRAGYLG